MKRSGLNWTADFSWYSWSKILSSDWLVRYAHNLYSWTDRHLLLWAQGGCHICAGTEPAINSMFLCIFYIVCYSQLQGVRLFWRLCFLLGKVVKDDLFSLSDIPKARPPCGWAWAWGEHLGQERSVSGLADEEDEHDDTDAPVDNLQQDQDRVLPLARAQPFHKERSTLKVFYLYLYLSI